MGQHAADAFPAVPADAPLQDRLRLVLGGVLGIPFTQGNRIRVLRNGDAAFPALLEAIASAEQSVNFLTFAWWRGEICERMAAALAERAHAGVTVRVLLDAFGAMWIPRRLLRSMGEAGVEVRWFRPLLTWKIRSLDNRTHRKVLVVDDRIAFTGGMGIAAEWEGDARNPAEWRDTHFRIQGPAVHGLQGAFFSNWAETGPLDLGLSGEIRPPEPATDGAWVQVIRASATVGWSDIATVLHLLIRLARRQLRITTAYFVPDGRTVQLLVEAAARGVAVEVVSPGPHIDMRVARVAGRATYRRLLDAGVRVWEYQPTMLHAKVVTVDASLALLGSANFNQRSMRRDDEVSLVVIDQETVRELDAHFEEDRGRSKPISLRWWRRRGWWRRLKEAIVYLFSHNI